MITGVGDHDEEGMVVVIVQVITSFGRLSVVHEARWTWTASRHSRHTHSMATAVTSGSPLSIWYQTSCVEAVVRGGRFEMLVVGVMCEVGGEVVVTCGPRGLWWWWWVWW